MNLPRRSFEGTRFDAAEKQESKLICLIYAHNFPNLGHSFPKIYSGSTAVWR